MVNEEKNKQPSDNEEIKVKAKGKAAKLATARDDFGKSVKKFSKDVDTLKTAMDATPEQISEALEEVVETVTEAATQLQQIDEALPGNGEPDEGIMGDTYDENHDENERTGQNGEPDEKDDKILKLEEQMGKIMSENLSMKKAGLAKRWASIFPQHLRKAQEDEFMKEHDEDEDLEKMEAKVTAGETSIKAYQTSGLINRSRTGGYGSYGPVPQMGKDSGKLQTGKAGEVIPWNMR